MIVIGPGGEKLVKTSTKQLWKRTVKITQQAQKEQLVVDGTDDIQTACIDDRMAALVGTFSQESEAVVPSHTLTDGSRAQAVTPSKSSPVKQEPIKQVSPFKQEPMEDDEERQALASRPNAKAKLEPGVKRTIVKQEPKTPRHPNAKVQACPEPQKSQKGPGRPSRDSCTLLAGALLLLLKASEACDRFFGPAWTNTVAIGTAT